MNLKTIVRAIHFGRGLLMCVGCLFALRFAAESAPAQTPTVVSYTNTTPITLPPYYDYEATPYPSIITVPSFNGTLQKVTVTLSGLSAGEPNTLEIAVAGPSTNVVVDLMFDDGFGDVVTNLNLTFDDNASGPLPESGQLVSGSYQPSGTDFGDNPAQTTNMLAGFIGTPFSGNWSLFVFDTGSYNSPNPDTITNWSLTLTYVQLIPIQFSNPQINSQGQFTALLSGAVGTPLVIESSTNLQTWTPVITNAMATSPVVFTDTNALGGYRFYQATTNSP
jgi:hypothetical protein